MTALTVIGCWIGLSVLLVLANARFWARVEPRNND